MPAESYALAHEDSLKRGSALWPEPSPRRQPAPLHDWHTLPELNTEAVSFFPEEHARRRDSSWQRQEGTHQHAKLPERRPRLVLLPERNTIPKLLRRKQIND